MSQHDPDEQTPSWPAWLVVVVILVILSWAGSGGLLYSRQDRGTFGDMFGAVNALFSGLAFVGIIYTVWLQRKELQLQRREMEETREELKGQKEQLAAQNETLRKQNFENTFFQLLRLHNDILNAIDRTFGNDTRHGRDCFTRFCRDFFAYLKQYRQEHSQDSEPEQIRHAYLEFGKKYQSEVGHYFRTLYNIVKFVNRSSVTDKRY